MKNKNAGKNAGKCWKNPEKDFNLVNWKIQKIQKLDFLDLLENAGKNAGKIQKIQNWIFFCWKNEK
jgi:hypothetical protein